MLCKIIYTTWPDSESAKSAARSLLNERLIACANILPEIHSLYTFEGVQEETSEAIMILKTSPQTLQKAIDKLHNIHPYTNPCILVLPVEGGSSAYLQWIARQTQC